MDLTAIRETVPGHATEISRLGQLADGSRLPVVTVLGKYNHGKSTLLNELIGHNVFDVSDARQTTRLDPFEQDNVRWLDAPGLDADVASQDDRLAMRGAWEEADIRLFVHSVREGELDRSEKELLAYLASDCKSSGRKAFVVLTQIEQLDEETLSGVLRTVREQVDSLEVFPVSAFRYRQGREGGKNLLLEKSGLLSLISRIKQAVADVPAARAGEMIVLGNILRGRLALASVPHQERLSMLAAKQSGMVKKFREEFSRVQAEIHEKIREA